MTQNQKYGFYVFIVIVLIYYINENNKKSATTPSTPTPTTSTPGVLPPRTGTSSAPPPTPTNAVKKAIYDTSGTTYADTILELYPDVKYTGYNDSGVNTDGTLSVADTCLAATDINGKYITFMSQKDGTENWILNSLKAAPGTILEFTSVTGGNISRAYIITQYNIPNLRQIFINYPILAGDQGVYMFDWLYWDMDFKVRAIDQVNLEKSKTAKYNDCYQTATDSYKYDDAKADKYCTLPDIVGSNIE